MDDFINPFLSPPAWPDNARSSWNGAVVSQTSNLLADSVEAYGEDQKDPSLCLASSTDVIGIAAAEDLNLHGHDGASSIFITRNLTYDIGKHQYPVERSSQNNLHTSQINSGTHDRSFNIHSGGGCNLAVKSFESALPHSALVISSSIESNISELSDFPQPLGDAHSIISIPTMWSPSYSTVSSFIGQGKLQATGFQGVESDDKILKKTCLENEKFRHLDGLPTASIRLKGNKDIHDPYYPSFTSGQQINLTTGTLQPPKEENGLHNLHLSSFPSGTQTVSSRMTGMQDSQKSPSSLSHTTGNQISGSQSQPVNANTSGCNGAVKPRVRARRGQATDPHSIAERLRRERIAERMKNLQELVPNSNKTDKASMLDEIIDYVKFLQLQVKVLSMSRLGAAGAVVPLLTDAQAEDYSCLLLGSSAGQGGIELSESENNLAFEQELVKLMESNLAAAMQYLQNKGLCLMPIALAAAISNQKASSTAIPSDCRKPSATHVTIPRSSQEYLERENVCAEGHNGHNGTVPKQEAARRPINNQRELKSQCKIAS